MNRAYIYILIGAGLWGTIAFFVKNLYALGFSPMEVVTLRVCTAAIILLSYQAVKSPESLKLKSVGDIKYFIGTGIFSIIFFNYCMFKTINLATIPIAFALLYTAPAFVIILSFILFQESLTVYKITALFLTLIGVMLVVELNPLQIDSLPVTAVLIGLGSGFGYALYSIFSKFALKKYSSLQITTYTFTIAAIALLPFFPYESKHHLLFHSSVILYAFGLGFLPTAVAYIIYTLGLELTETSKASILATVEPVVATLIGIFIFFEPFSFIQMIGMGSIIVAVIIIQLSENKHNNISNQGY